MLLGVLCAAVVLAVSSTLPLEAAATKRHIAVVSITKGFRHSSIPLGEKIVKDLGDKTGQWDVDYVRTDEEMAQKMTPEGLKKYDAVFLNNTTGDLPLPDKQAFLGWIRAGGNIIGIHAATDTFHNWPEFIHMMGAQFAGHGAQSQVTCIVEDRKHPATKDLRAQFQVLEEVYQFKDFSRENMHGLITLDQHPNTGDPGDYPVSWCRMEGKGRVFYTSLGHREDLMQGELYQKHLTGGIRWALGLAKGDARPVKPQPVTSAEKKQGFRALFDGVNLKGWHNRDEGRTPWTAQNAMLVMGKGGADLITDAQFRNFTIRYEYLVPKGGNSGLYLRGRYEIQVLDDFDTKKADVHGNGSIYGLITPSSFAGRPAGEWQTVEATLIGNKVTVILNGVKIVDNQALASVTGGALDDKMDVPGPIMVQGDHGPIAYRIIRIKPLPGK